MNALYLSLITCILLLEPLVCGANGQEPEKDPFGGEQNPERPRELSEAAQKTLKTLEMEKLESVHIEPETRYDALRILKEALAKRGVTVRLKTVGTHQTLPKGPLNLRGIPVREFMRYLDWWAGWGWIVYEDGSITYFDYQCACLMPKDGIRYHAEQYEAGKPELMAKEQSKRVEKSNDAGAVAPSATDSAQP